MSELALRALAKTFATTRVLHALDLDVPSGALIAILGASGSGKTTLLRLIAGFERADSGSITIAGREVSAPGLHVPPEQRRIGYVAQDGALFPHLDVAANILFGLPRAARRDSARAAALLRLVGLPAGYAVRDPASLSGGEQQRVALARALAPGPRLVLLDEPFSALDAGLRAETRQAVAAALREAGATAVLVTHDQAEALSMGDQVAMLRGGRLAQVAAPQTLYRAPADIETARFVGDAVLLPARAAGGLAQTALGTIPLVPPGAQGECLVMLRPEQIRCIADAAAPAATVVSVVFQGAETILRLRLADDQIVQCRAQGIAALGLGDRTGLCVTGAAIAYPSLTERCDPTTQVS